MAAAPKKHSVYMAFEAPPELAAAVDAEAERLGEVLGQRATRSTALRRLIALGLRSKGG